MLGTGWIPNSDTYIEPKKNSIGSKNFGLRSLFTVGDEIRCVLRGQVVSPQLAARGHLPTQEKRTIRPSVVFASKFRTVPLKLEHSKPSLPRGEARGPGR